MSEVLCCDTILRALAYSIAANGVARDTSSDSGHPAFRPLGQPAADQIRSRRICHGVFAPNIKHRARVTPAKRGKGGQRPTTEELDEPTPAERRGAMRWAQRLKSVFGIDIETCPACGDAVRVIACIEG